MKTSYISCYDQDTHEISHFEVHYSVYVYIKQLEAYINNPEYSKLKELYQNRFKTDTKGDE